MSNVCRLWSDCCVRAILLVSLCFVFGISVSGCGGSSGGSDGSEVEGTLTRSASSAVLARTVGQGIQGVNVCALGSCGVSDEVGHWSFSVPGNAFAGDDVLFTFQGNGIDSTAIVSVSEVNPAEVVVDFVYDEDDEGNEIETLEISVTPRSEDEDSQDQDDDEQSQDDGDDQSAGDDDGQSEEDDDELSQDDDEVSQDDDEVSQDDETEDDQSQSEDDQSQEDAAEDSDDQSEDDDDELSQEREQEQEREEPHAEDSEGAEQDRDRDQDMIQTEGGPGPESQS